MDCLWCHNPEAIASKRQLFFHDDIGAEMSIDEVMLEIIVDFDFYTNSGGGMTLSGGEPLLHFSFSMKLLKRCKEMDVSTCVETSGFVSAIQFKQLLPFVDLLLFDYKITGSKEHKKFTGAQNKLVLENLDVAYQHEIPIILRCIVVPGINDTDQHFKDIITWTEALIII